MCKPEDYPAIAATSCKPGQGQGKPSRKFPRKGEQTSRRLQVIVKQRMPIFLAMSYGVTVLMGFMPYQSHILYNPIKGVRSCTSYGELITKFSLPLEQEIRIILFATLMTAKHAAFSTLSLELRNRDKFSSNLRDRIKKVSL